MAKYRKKPIKIDAMLLNRSSFERVQNWLFTNEVHFLYDVENVNIHIETLEGVMKAEHGDFIIKGVQGEFYPCKPDIFKATYEKVGE